MLDVSKHLMYCNAGITTSRYMLEASYNKPEQMACTHVSFCAVLFIYTVVSQKYAHGNFSEKRGVGRIFKNLHDLSEVIVR